MKKNYAPFLALLAFIIFNINNSHGQTVQWAKKGISPGFENGNAVVADDSGNVYVTGQFEYSSVFDNYTLNSYGSHDIFVAKYNSSGNIVWIKGAGGTDGDIGLGIGIDAQHNVYICGEIEQTVRFSSTISLTSAGSNDVFIAKYDANGNVRWAKKFGDATASDKGRAIAVSPSGNCYITGNFSGTVTAGTKTISSDGGNDIFIVKYDTNGNVAWAKRGGGSKQDRGFGIAIDAAENVFVTGSFTSSARFHNTTITNSGPNSTFLAKYNSSGTFQWAKSAGTCCDTTEANAIALDEVGNIYLAGAFKGTTRFGSLSLTTHGDRDMFLVKYNSSGTEQWAKRVGCATEDIGYGVAVDKTNHRVYVSGFITGSGSTSGLPFTFAGYKDLMIAAYSTDGAIKWVKSFGGTRRDMGLAIAVNSQGFIYSTGLFNGTAAFGPYNLVGYPNQPWADFYIAKISPPQTIAPPISMSTDDDAIFEAASNLNRNEFENSTTASKFDKISVYPNPSDEKFNFTSEEIISYKVYNVFGAVMIHQENISGELFFGEELEAGVYYLELHSATEKKIVTIVKSN